MVGIFAIIAIYGQAIFAIVAIDLFAKTANTSDMSKLQEEQRIWLNERLKQAGHGSKGELAKALNVRPDAVTRMSNLDLSKEGRDISLEELRKIADFFGEAPPGLVVSQVAAPAPKFLRSSKHKFYVREWRKFMAGDKIDAAAKAAGLPPDEYQAFETYPINFTLGQIAALADELGIRGDQFWFPPPKTPKLAAVHPPIRAKASTKR